ncbi:hypothetical protein ACFFKU_03785 [Kineococcus gynurae]|uniref:Uncharacterized protein n=1 Tax=Kineococcus gynurae TaxID=452979 RepID=A0ABV5LRV6_9ACTN
MDDGVEQVHEAVRTIPAGIGVVRDADRAGRALRVSAHPDHGADGRVVLSLWEQQTCVSTLRLDRAATVELLALLGTALLPVPSREG